MLSNIIKHLLSKDGLHWLVYYSLCTTNLKMKLSDSNFLRLQFRCATGMDLNLGNPVTFNEKLQWLKIYDRNPLYTIMVDKLSVKDYISNQIGSEYVIPVLGSWDTTDDIDWAVLPNQFVLKCSHDSGGLVICKDKTILDKAAVKKKLEASLKHNYFEHSREWPYKDVPRKIFAEKYMTEDNDELKDYKFFCFNGVVKFFKVDFNRYIKHQANYYDRNLTFLPFYETVCPNDENHHINFPSNIEEMMTIAEKLSHNIPFVRIDLYNVKGRILFGEMTFFPAGGMGEILPKEWNTIIGGYLKLPIS